MPIAWSKTGKASGYIVCRVVLLSSYVRGANLLQGFSEVGCTGGNAGVVDLVQARTMVHDVLVGDGDAVIAHNYDPVRCAIGSLKVGGTTCVGACGAATTLGAVLLSQWM